MHPCFRNLIIGWGTEREEARNVMMLLYYPKNHSHLPVLQDVSSLTTFFQTACGITPEEKQLSVSGKNWGEVDLNGKYMMSFLAFCILLVQGNGNVT